MVKGFVYWVNISVPSGTHVLWFKSSTENVYMCVWDWIDKCRNVCLRYRCQFVITRICIKWFGPVRQRSVLIIKVSLTKRVDSKPFWWHFPQILKKYTHTLKGGSLRLPCAQLQEAECGRVGRQSDRTHGQYSGRGEYYGRAHDLVVLRTALTVLRPIPSIDDVQ